MRLLVKKKEAFRHSTFETRIVKATINILNKITTDVSIKEITKVDGNNNHQIADHLIKDLNSSLATTRGKIEVDFLMQIIIVEMALEVRMNIVEIIITSNHVMLILVVKVVIVTVVNLIETNIEVTGTIKEVAILNQVFIKCVKDQKVVQIFKIVEEEPIIEEVIITVVTIGVGLETIQASEEIIKVIPVDICSEINLWKQKIF